MASSPSPSTSPRRWPPWLPKVGWTILGLLAATLLVFVATVTFGGVHGTEFCPQTFERRSYSYYELPLVRVQMTGEQHEDLTGDTELLVTSKKYVTPPPGGKKDWHVLAGSRGTRSRRPGDAGILVQYLDATEEGETHRWVHWSETHDEAAKVLWPAVQQLAQHELYVFVPDVFDLAKAVDDPKQLKLEIDRVLARKLLDQARRLKDRGDSAVAIGLLDQAIALDPANGEIKTTRDAFRAAAKPDGNDPKSSPAAATTK